MTASEFDPDLLLRFKVPQESTATAKNPLRIEAEIVRGKAQGPFMLKGFVLLPLQQRLVSHLDGKEDEKVDHPTKKEKDTRKYVKLPFGKMDVFAPLEANKPFLLFPYEDANVVRKRVRPGDVVLVGVEAVALSTKKEGKDEKLDIDVKVRRLLAW